jgi:hypothetical protein
VSHFRIHRQRNHVWESKYLSKLSSQVIYCFMGAQFHTLEFISVAERWFTHRVLVLELKSQRADLLEESL